MPALTDFFRSQGYTLTPDDDTATVQVVRGRTPTTGIRFSGDHTSGRVTIDGSSACAPPG